MVSVTVRVDYWSGKDSLKRAITPWSCQQTTVSFKIIDNAHDNTIWRKSAFTWNMNRSEWSQEEKRLVTRKTVIKLTNRRSRSKWSYKRWNDEVKNEVVQWIVWMREMRERTDQSLTSFLLQPLKVIILRRMSLESTYLRSWTKKATEVDNVAFASFSVTYCTLFLLLL